MSSLKFINGGSPLYLGSDCNGGEDLLTQLATLLLTTDTPWVLDNQITGSGLLTGIGVTDNGHNCFFVAQDDPSNNRIIFNGSSDNTFNTTLSSPFYLEYSNTIDRLCITCKDDFISIQNWKLNEIDSIATGLFFGFIDRKDLTDSDAVIINNHDIYTAGFTEIMRDYETKSIDWYKVYQGFGDFALYQRDNSSIAGTDMMVNHWIDPLLSEFAYQTSGNTSTFGTGNNLCSNNMNGTYNALNNLPETDKIRIIEARNNSKVFYSSSSTSPKEGRPQNGLNLLNYRGDLPVNILRRGVSFYQAGKQFTDTDGNTYKATGVGKLGMRIA